MGYRNVRPQEFTVNGKVSQVPSAFQGALGWSEYSMLKLMYREWLRPLGDDATVAGIPPGHKPSSRALIVLLFWTYLKR